MSRNVKSPAMASNYVHMASILIVDDEKPVRELVYRWLASEGYICETAANASSAMAALIGRTFDVILCDINLPGFSGLELLPHLQHSAPDTSVVMLTGCNDAESAVKALTYGACGYLVKPTSQEALIEQVAQALQRRWSILEGRQEARLLELAVSQHVQDLEFDQRQMIQRLITASMYRDKETGAHIKRTGLLAEAFARELGCTNNVVEQIRLAAPLHDIGKLGIPDTILQKVGPLSKEEFAVMQSHTVIGGRLLAGSRWPVLQLAREIAVYHHEWFNGKGYPYGLCGETIPMAARIVSLVDVYDALTHDRVYRAALPEDEAIEIMSNACGSQFDPKLFQVFHNVLPELRQISLDHPDDELVDDFFGQSAEPECLLTI